MRISFSDKPLLIEGERVNLLINPEDDKVPPLNGKDLYVFLTKSTKGYSERDIFKLPASDFYISKRLFDDLIPTDRTTLIEPNDRLESDYFKFQVFGEEELSLKIEMDERTLIYLGKDTDYQEESKDILILSPERNKERVDSI